MPPKSRCAYTRPPGVKIAAGINDATANLEINWTIAGHAPFVQSRCREFKVFCSIPRVVVFLTVGRWSLL